MHPSFVVNDHVDSSLANAVLGCQCSLTNVANGIFCPDFSYLLFGKPRTSILFAAKPRLSQPAFFERVSYIVGLGSQKQMRRITAETIIAMMTNTNVCWKGTLGNDPSNAVGHSHLARSTMKSKPTVTVRKTTCHPRPTFFGLADAYLTPKTKNVLRTERRNHKMFLSHDSLLTRGFWLERLAVNSQAVRFDENYNTMAA